LSLRFKFERQSVKHDKDLLHVLELMVFSDTSVPSSSPTSLSLPDSELKPSTSPLSMKLDIHDLATRNQPALSSSQDISTWKILHVYASRFVLCANKYQYLFFDRFWPTCCLSELTSVRQDLTEDELLFMFMSGIVPPALE